MDLKIKVHNLKLGMFVVELDRPWLGTPFPFQGFWVWEPETIQTLSRYCDSVYIRTELTKHVRDDGDVANVDWKDRVAKADREIGPLDFLPKTPVVHEDVVAVEHEIDSAQSARRRVADRIRELLNDVQRGRKLELIGVKEAVIDLTASVLRNPDASMWLRLVKDKDTYTYFHLIDTSALAIAFGRHMGFSRDELADLGLGALLIDVGKVRLSKKLIHKPGNLTDEEQALVKKHVDYSIELVLQMSGVSNRVIEMVAAHHERYDGKGYPRGLHGRNIPPFARMVSIADCFDAITSIRPHAEPMSPHEAMRKLYDWSGKDFQPELVEQFIQCLGIYPTGTFVELSTGEIGVVISQNRKRRLKPRLMLVLAPDRRRYETFPVLDLMERYEDDSKNQIYIKSAVEPENYGINPREFHISKLRRETHFRLSDLT